jgi:hypothetical protein
LRGAITQKVWTSCEARLSMEEKLSYFRKRHVHTETERTNP